MAIILILLLCSEMECKEVRIDTPTTYTCGSYSHDMLTEYVRLYYEDWEFMSWRCDRWLEA